MRGFRKIRVWLTISVIFLGSCLKEEPLELISYQFVNHLELSYLPVSPQKYGIYATDGVFMTNDFPTGRAHGLEKINDSTFRIDIRPENEPIGNTPWYAFKIWSHVQRNIYLELDYGYFQHRYQPKISKDGRNWTKLEWPTSKDGSTDPCLFNLSLSSDTTWVAAQEIIDYEHVGNWVKSISRFDNVESGVAGKSILGRDLYFLDMGPYDKSNKPAIIFFSRQHPAEVSGFIYMQYLVERILTSIEYVDFLDEFRILVYPLINPDGVDLGHWRHNMGGVDLNNDWACYYQKETREIAGHALNETSKFENNVVLGIDFHSTEQNMLLTFDHTMTSKMFWFTPQWSEKICEPGNEESYSIKSTGLSSPVSKSWFYVQFGAESLTIEIDDEAERNNIREKAYKAADHLMEILLDNQHQID